MDGADAVVHSAAVLPNAAGVSAAQYMDANRGGTETVLRVALRQRVKAGVFFSTISVVEPQRQKN
jgi:nucleoside-diphosphate-sugar epimerase